MSHIVKLDFGHSAHRYIIDCLAIRVHLGAMEKCENIERDVFKTIQDKKQYVI